MSAITDYTRKGTGDDLSEPGSQFISHINPATALRGMSSQTHFCQELRILKSKLRDATSKGLSAKYRGQARQENNVIIHKKAGQHEEHIKI
ncbi:MAG TPA: hypothetical protein VN176_07895 [Verrucomicrobiae bacterium]|nr:hypothetical protein [Verrucomicrobiae bacterium]